MRLTLYPLCISTHTTTHTHTERQRCSLDIDVIDTLLGRAPARSMTSQYGEFHQQVTDGGTTDRSARCLRGDTRRVFRARGRGPGRPPPRRRRASTSARHRLIDGARDTEGFLCRRRPRHRRMSSIQIADQFHATRQCAHTRTWGRTSAIICGEDSSNCSTFRRIYRTHSFAAPVPSVL